MVRKKKEVAVEADVAEAEADVVEAEATEPQEAESKSPLGEAQEAFLARLQKTASFDGGLVWLDCPLAGYEGVRVAFNVDNQYAVQELYEMKPRGIAPVDIYRLMSLFVRRIEWPFPVPAPTPDDPMSYEVLIYQFRGLLEWCRGAGYQAAKDARWGNS